MVRRVQIHVYRAENPRHSKPGKEGKQCMVDCNRRPNTMTSTYRHKSICANGRRVLEPIHPQGVELQRRCLSVPETALTCDKIGTRHQSKAAFDRPPFII